MSLEGRSCLVSSLGCFWSGIKESSCPSEVPPSLNSRLTPSYLNSGEAGEVTNQFLTGNGDAQKGWKLGSASCQKETRCMCWLASVKSLPV